MKTFKISGQNENTPKVGGQKWTLVFFFTVAKADVSNMHQ